MLPLSICMITKNEEKHIKNCLEALKPLTNAGAELVLTDTGSTDQTLSLAKAFTDSIHSFTWCDDFSAARNFCAGKANNDWILAVDSDEILQSADCKKLSSFLAHGNQTAKEKNNVPACGMIRRLSPCKTSSGSSTTVDDLARLYHKNFYHYEGIIHEQIFRIDHTTPHYQKLPLSFLHLGYNDPAIMPEKIKRNIKLLLKAYQQDETDTYTLFQLGQSYRLLKQYEKALSYFDKALSYDIDPALQYVQTLVEVYGYTLLDLKQPQKALELYGVYDTFCKRADFVFLMGLVSMQNGLLKQAIAEFKKAVTIPAYSVEGTNSYSAYYNIGVIYECSGRLNDAKRYYEKCGKYAPAIERLHNIQK